MKTTYENNAILQEMNKLISSSCQQVNPKFEKFQQALIKKHFGALQATNDLLKKEVHLKLMVKEGQYTHVVVQYNNFEEFLKSCLEDDLGNLSFYQNMLTFYNTSVDVA
ncbi:MULTISPECIES: hypothetical protein [Mesonia]|uniref:Uncharacterized protein n=1 Tax=Mesonia oceanica TaxID=2687242 RepID=A0AC61Y8C0_9FLAO|nr:MULTISPECIES: hypothetical protein [Mesonia]MAN27445.1 hypothetical protein [Mesonia sp.]MAQ40281.1 hypothetical protein [Mesonia sp.]MBJ97191.1 hypothetical protein [Flavobacteriaceae bacterium]VVV00712.1 hypothetical protein FVB9532_01987 [Mesonia oceanica]|tara:strand:+ start:4730 stop:5056 length:327 start_codon:yes stop_codon:yes gene_type:complete